jgi:hypothetical protein
METDPVSEPLCFLVFRNPDDCRSPGNPVILIIIVAYKLAAIASCTNTSSTNMQIMVHDHDCGYVFPVDPTEYVPPLLFI